MFLTIFLLVFAVLILLLRLWNQVKYPDRVFRIDKLPRVPSLKDLKEILHYKQKKKFYEEGYADEIDEPNEEEQNSKSSRS